MMIRRLLSCLFVLTLIALAQPVHAAPVPLAPNDARDVRCAAAFAVVAVGQARGDAGASALPPLAVRGRQFMGVVGARLTANNAMPPAAVQQALTDAARGMTVPGAVAVARTCLAALDQTMPPRPAPDAPRCEALLSVYAEVLGARDPADPRAAAMQRDAQALAGAASAALTARGITGDAQAAARETARASVRDELVHRRDTINADDFAQCRRMAATPR